MLSFLRKPAATLVAIADDLIQQILRIALKLAHFDALSQL